ncbi:hypothetical protein AGR2A_pc0021 [Agrobacterium genomosp. 2 str. CFBP 5494]|uniref:Uncharacterized protein n=1 Tax=Agrobacterium genomosp. 2 str. CFBP 5494 TaxID=1183436 RepID=A0A9W5F3X6_9HYPH|nr:hypothetical protein AGR2A_pc0021 [Agrobacterium genomosp. 2 str. CFBP 5494]
MSILVSQQNCIMKVHNEYTYDIQLANNER